MISSYTAYIHTCRMLSSARRSHLAWGFAALRATEIVHELLRTITDGLCQMQLLSFGVPLRCKSEKLQLFSKGGGIDCGLLSAPP